jgi:imidazolonepropionase-like amidohydrolase
LIDGTGADPRRDASIAVREGRIEAVDGRVGDLAVVDLSGKWVIPGLLDANTHLFVAMQPEYILSREIGSYDDYVLEAAQVALRAGVTTVFDT